MAFFHRCKRASHRVASALVLGLFGGMAALLAQAMADENPSLTLPALLVELEERSPLLLARRAEVWASRQRPAQVRAFDDPRLSIELWQAPIDGSQVPLMFTLRQPIPWPGKLRARAAVLETDISRAESESTLTLSMLRREITRSYYDYRLAVRSMEVLRATQKLLFTVVAAANIRYRVGRAELAEVLRAETTLANLSNQLIDTERESLLFANHLNALLAWPEHPLGVPITAPSVHTDFDPDRLIGWALAHRSEGALVRAALTEVAARAAAAKAERAPDLSAWVGFMAIARGSNEHAVTLGVETSLPTFSLQKSSAAGREAAAQREVQLAKLRQVEASIIEEVRSALTQLDATQRHLNLHQQSLIPLSERSLRAAQIGYQSGRADLTTLLEAARELFMHQLEYERYSADYGQRLADLEAAIGTPLEALNAGPSGGGTP